MNSKAFKIAIIYLLGFLTGINFVVFPALGTVFTDAKIFGLSQSQFGNLFIPQVICIIISCLLAPFLVNKLGPKKVLALGLLMMIFSTAMLWILHFAMNNHEILFPTLMVLVAFMGFGFGLSVTTLNPLVAHLFPENKSSAILVLQFLVGLGTSTSPLLLNLVGKNENWRFVPEIIFIVVFLVFIFFLFLKFEKENFFKLPSKLKIPAKLWLFFLAIVMYGCIEGTFGSFGAIILKNKGLDNSSATLGLSLFWGGIALNRLLFGILSKPYNLSYFYLFSPLLVGILLFLLPNFSDVKLILILLFLIGFFMGCIFPGSIGWGTIEFPLLSVLVSGFLMAANQFGTGIVTNVLGGFSEQTDVILRVLSGSTVLIFILLMVLKKNSKIKEAF